MTGCTQCFQICLGLSKRTSSCCFPARAAKHGTGDLCETQAVEGGAACRALVPCAVTVPPWTSETVRICDAICTPHVTSPTTQKFQSPSTTKDFSNYKCCYRVLVPEFFSATLNDSNFFPPRFNSACRPGTSIEVWGLALQGSPHR